MTIEARDRAPTAEEIERRFGSLAVLGFRPALWAAILGLKVVRRFDWKAQCDIDIARLDGPLVFAANHRSHADTAAILGTLPQSICRRTAVAAALDVFGADHTNGLRRRLSRDVLQLTVASAFHAFAFDRQGPPLRSVRTSVQLIRNGWNLLLYPEGTRSRDGQISEFKGGVGLLAKFTGRPVVPVFVDGGETILPYGNSIPGPGIALVRYGKPLVFDANDTPVTFTERVQQEVEKLGLRQARASAKLATISTHPYFHARKQPA